MLEWIAMIVVLTTMAITYIAVYKYLIKRTVELDKLSEEERLGVQKGIYRLPKDCPWYKNPHTWEILMLLFIILLWIIFW